MKHKLWKKGPPSKRTSEETSFKKKILRDSDKFKKMVHTSKDRIIYI